MTGRKEYISKDAALRFCVEVLESDTAYSTDVRNAFRAYKSYLEGLKTIETTACTECVYAMKKETPVKTIRYECMFDKCWRDEHGNCEHGRCTEDAWKGKTMSRYIDADSIYDKVEANYRMSEGVQHECEREFLNLICDAPTVDAVPVVRCKECVWRHDDSSPIWLPCMSKDTDDDWFCADGERKDGEPDV